MPRFIIERNFAEKLELSEEAKLEVQKINTTEDVEWIFSFLSADKRKTYCLYEAPDADAIRRAAEKANIPADVITPVDQVNPALFAA